MAQERKQTGDRWSVNAATAAMNSSAIREILAVVDRPGMLSFAGGLPNPEGFPAEAVAAAAQAVLRDPSRAALQYGPTEGYRPLREAIAARLSARGMAAEPEEILITSGSQQGIDLLAKALIQPGDTVYARNPSFLGALQAFSFYGPRFAAWPPAGEVPAGRSAFGYFTPTFANPTGETLADDERQALVEQADRLGLPVIEDDPYGELWLDAPPPASLRSRNPEGVAYLGSFSKTLAPGLRVGFVAAPRRLIAQLAKLKQGADLHSSGLDQRIVAHLLADGTLERHLPAVRARYRRQRDALAAALERHLRPFADWQVPAGGMFFWATLKPGLSAARLFQAGLEQNVAFVPGYPFYFGEAGEEAGRTLRLSFATVDPARMDGAMARLAEAARGLLAAG